MKIRMLEERTGPRYDGQSWPGYGGEISVPDDEARSLCETGAAVPAADRDADVELRAASPDAPQQEQHGGEPPPGAVPSATPEGEPPGPAEPGPDPAAVAKPAPGASKAEWVAWVTSHGLAAADAEAMSKSQLMERYG